jgi:hypothetical protein
MARQRAPLFGTLPPELASLTLLNQPTVMLDLPSVNWSSVLRIANYHQLTGRLALALNRLPQLPEGLQPYEQHLRSTYERNEQRFNDSALPQLRELIAVLLEARVTPTILKGAALVTASFVPAGARPMSDIDVLVPRTAVAAAKEQLHVAGYRTSADERTRRWAEVGHYQDAPLHHPQHELMIDLHWHIQHPHHRRPFDPDALQRIPLSFGPRGPVAQRLSNGDMLAHLCLHFLKDREQGRPGALGQLWDVLDVASRLDVTAWAELAQASRQRGHSYSVAAVVGLAHLLLGLPLPPAFDEVGPLVTDQRLHSFAYRRVLAPRPAQSQLLMVTPDVEYRLGRIVARVLWHARNVSPAGIASPDDASARLRRAASIAKLAVRSLPVSDNARSEIALDRWAHDLL